MVSRQQALNTLHRFKNEQGDKYGIVSLGIFGSMARNQQAEGSDIDIVVETRTVDPFQLVHLKEQLETMFDTRIDIVRVRKNMNQFLRKRIDRDAIYV